MQASDGLDAIDANYLEASRIFVSYADTGEYRESKDAVIVCCGLPTESLNFGFLRHAVWRSCERPRQPSGPTSTAAGSASS